ncbi:hypothetical protein NP493_1988g00014 [Ridgeia piscesae]|uniref:Uncharacterized protein n=1 Tax=Ridgeia piscesae TaxID=27915 RepID=A0AAD9JND0_RIDPI|nr:hypothetical protein NP493_1988g00014 [Ridgeia piscesae]
MRVVAAVCASVAEFNEGIGMTVERTFALMAIATGQQRKKLTETNYAGRTAGQVSAGRAVGYDVQIFAVRADCWAGQEMNNIRGGAVSTHQLLLYSLLQLVQMTFPQQQFLVLHNKLGHLHNKSYDCCDNSEDCELCTGQRDDQRHGG